MGNIILNDEQKEAVEYNGGALLIIAGAGTGKTTVITERIKYLIKEHNLLPSDILAVTFTEKAAREMEERVDKILPYGYTQTWISTFHSFCDRVLRNEAIHIGLDPTYRLIGETEASQLLRENLWDMDLVYFRPRGNPTKFISGLLAHFNRLKDEDISPEEYANWVKSKAQNANPKEFPKEEILKFRELSEIYKQYEELKIKQGLMDFSDLISNTLYLFRKRKNVLSRYQNKFKYILVDEFQDTNIAQYELIKLLSPDGRKPQLTVVGDDSQSIYKFRGAAVSNILSFMEDYKDTKQITLTKNYRSTQKILNHAYKLIKNNDPDTLENKLGINKNLKSTRKSAKQIAPQLIWEEKVEDETEQVALAIKNLHEKENYQWKDFAILVRANNHAEPFVRALRRNLIPFQFLGPGRLFRQEEIRDLIAYLKTLAHFDDSASFYRVLAMSIWNITGRDLSALNTCAKRTNFSLFEICEEIVKKEENRASDLQVEEYRLPRISEQTKQALRKIVKMVKRHLDLVPKETAGQLLYFFLEDSGLLQRLVGRVASKKQEKEILNISSFFNKLKNYETENEDASVFAVVDWIELAMQLGESPLASDTDWVAEDKVNILTVHSAKGLEFAVVFLVNLVNNRFPAVNRSEQIPIPDDLIRESLPEGDYHEQEERRLFYVGMTRAMDRLYFTASKFYNGRKREKKLSGFVKEALGKEKIDYIQNKEKHDQLGLFAVWERKEQTGNRKQKTENAHKVSFLSYSQIKTFQMCPLHYKLRYILHIPTPVSAAQSFGTNIHTALRDYYTYLMQTKKHKKDKLMQYLKDNWKTVGFSNIKEAKANYKTARQYLSDYYEHESKRKIKTKAVEEKFVFPLAKGLKIIGIIDRLDVLPEGGVEIIDYKTSETVPDQKKVDKDLQMTIYWLAATEIRHPLLLKQPDEIKLSLYYFAEQKKFTTTRTSKQLIEAKEEILDIAGEIEKSDFSCSNHPWCKTCEYSLYCGTE